MANTWTVYLPGVTFADGKAMAGVINAGTRLIKIRRIRFLNTQTTGVAGQICYGDIRRYTSATWTGASPVTPFPHDTGNSALVDTTCGYGGTPGGTATILRNYLWSSDEPAVGGQTIDEWETIVPFNIVWELGFGDSSLTPLTLREDEMVIIYNYSGSTGNVDIYITFTDESGGIG